MDWNKLSDSDFFSNKLQHILFYGHVDQKSVQKLQTDLENATKNVVEGVKIKIKPIVIHVHSHGGDAYMGLSLAYLIRQYKHVDICVMVDGFCCSAATPLLIAAPFRVLHDFAFVLIHEGSVTPPPFKPFKESEFAFINKQMTVIAQNYKDLYLQFCNIPEHKLDDLLSRELFVDASFCLKHAVVDRVLKLYTNNKKIKIGDDIIYNNSLNHLRVFSSADASVYEWLTNVSNVLQKFFDSGSHNPIVLHLHPFYAPDNLRFFDILPLCARFALCPSYSSIFSIVESDIDLVSFMPAVLSHGIVFNANSKVFIDLTTRFNDISKYPKDFQPNYNIAIHAIKRFFHKFFNTIKIPPLIGKMTMWTPPKLVT